MSPLRFAVIALFLLFAVGLGSAAKVESPGAAVAGAAIFATDERTRHDDPFPIARIRVTEERLNQILKSSDFGPLTRLPRSEFEARVRTAALAARAERDPPRLVEASYSATLSGDDLTGEAQWTFINPHSKPAAFSLGAVKLALSAPSWADGSEAILGAAGKGLPEIWVPAGRQTLKVKWSASGAGLAAERQFELHFPPSASTLLDLDLPPDRAPLNSSEVLLTGPFPNAKNPGLRNWRFRFGDRTKMEFGIRGPAESGSTAIIASLAAKCELARGQIACAFEYDLRSSHGSLAEWAFDLSPGLNVETVVVNDRASWRVDPATRQLHVALRQPSTGAKFAIGGSVPLPTSGLAIPLPKIRPRNAVGSEERWELKVAADLELERLDAPDYRIAGSSIAMDGARLVTLVGTLLPPGAAFADRRVPTIRAAAAEANFATTEGLDWRVESGRLHLAARVGVRVRRGPLFRLEFRTPPGYLFDRLTSTPDDGVSYSGSTPTGLEVEFARPLTSGQQIELWVEFRGPLLPVFGTRLSFPRFAPLGTSERDGWLSFSPSPAWLPEALAAPGTRLIAKAERVEGVPVEASFVAAFRGVEPSGTMVLTPVRPEFAAAMLSRFEGGGNLVNAVTHTTLKVKAGLLSSVGFFEPGPRNQQRAWKLANGTNAIASATPIDLGDWPNAIPPIGPSTAWSLLATRSIPSAGTYWIVRFARPMSGEATLESSAMIPRERAAQSPLIVLGTAESLSKIEPNPQASKSLPEAFVPANAWTFEGLHLVTLCTESHALVVLGGTITGRAGVDLRIAMPPGAEVRAACVGGYWLDPGRCELIPSAEGSKLRLPIPTGSGNVRFEVRYRVPAPLHAPGWVRSPEPRLPGEGHSIARWWAFARGVAAGWPLTLSNRAAVGDWPVLLGEPLQSPAGELAVSRDAVESAFVVPVQLLDSAGAAMAALLAAISWAGVRRASRVLGIVLLAIVILSGAAYWVGPSAWERVAFPPLLTSLLGAAAVIVARSRSSSLPRTVVVPSRLAGIAVALALALIPVLAARAQTPAPRDVAFIVPGAEPSRESVVVPSVSLDRLDAMGGSTEPALVVTSASYQGRLEEGLARFDARFVVHAFHDREAILELPLAEVRLERATVDGQPAQPTARPDSYSLPVSGRGRHVVELRFAVAVTSTGPEREVRFGVPEVLATRLAFAAPATARQLQAVGRLGDQRISEEKDRVQLEAALGGVRDVRLRWREGAGGTAPIVSLREGCIWDVSERGHELTACYQVQIESGSVSSFRFDLPSGLEPVRVAVRSLDSILGANVLRDWSVGKDAAGLRPLRIDLNGPTDGRLLVTLECVPRGAPSRLPVLRFPQPVGMKRVEAIYGLRANGVVIESIGRSGVIDFAADVLARDFGSIPDLRLNPAVPVVAFSPRAGEVAELRPAIRSGPELPAFSQDLTWNIAPQLATGVGSLKWSSNEPVSMVEFSLAATIGELRANDLASWAQTEGRVQVWLRKPTKDVQVDWQASFARQPQANAAPFEPPLPTVSQARIANQIVRLRPEDGWGVRVERDKGWTAVLTNDRLWSFQAEGNQPPPRLQLFPPVAVSTRGVGLVELSGFEAAYRISLDAVLPTDRPHHLALTVRKLPPGAVASLDAPPGTLVHETLNEEGSREWDLDVPAGSTPAFRSALIVKFAAKGTVALPTLDFQTAGGIPRSGGVVKWIGLTGPRRELRLEGATPASAGEFAAILAAWPGESERLRRVGGSMWSVPNGSAVLAFAPTPAPQAKAPAATAKPAPIETVPIPSTIPSYLMALAWCGTAVGVLVLSVRSPRHTWPEQVGLLGGLFGFAVAGGWIAGLMAYAAARMVWLIGVVAGSRR